MLFNNSDPFLAFLRKHFSIYDDGVKNTCKEPVNQSSSEYGTMGFNYEGYDNKRKRDGSTIAIYYRENDNSDFAFHGHKDPKQKQKKVDSTNNRIQEFLKFLRDNKINYTIEKPGLKTINLDITSQIKLCKAKKLSNNEILAIFDKEAEHLPALKLAMIFNKYDSISPFRHHDALANGIIDKLLNNPKSNVEACRQTITKMVENHKKLIPIKQDGKFHSLYAEAMILCDTLRPVSDNTTTPGSKP